MVPFMSEVRTCVYCFDIQSQWPVGWEHPACVRVCGVCVCVHVSHSLKYYYNEHSFTVSYSTPSPTPLSSPPLPSLTLYSEDNVPRCSPNSVGGDTCVHSSLCSLDIVELQE